MKSHHWRWIVAVALLAAGVVAMDATYDGTINRTFGILLSVQCLHWSGWMWRAWAEVA